MERVHVIARGRVQGVFFRAGTIREANALGVTGYVRNLPDGTVEAVAEGARPKLDLFVKWLRRGPEMALVEGLDVTWEKSSGEFQTFGLA